MPSNTRCYKYTVHVALVRAPIFRAQGSEGDVTLYHISSASSSLLLCSSSLASRSSASTTSISSGNVRIAAIPVNWLSSSQILSENTDLNLQSILTLTGFVHARENQHLCVFLANVLHKLNVSFTHGGVARSIKYIMNTSLVSLAQLVHT